MSWMGKLSANDTKHMKISTPQRKGSWLVTYSHGCPWITTQKGPTAHDQGLRSITDLWNDSMQRSLQL